MRPRAPAAPTGAGRSLRVAIVADLIEERWPSMDLVADMLARHLGAIGERSGLHVELLRPTLARGCRQASEVPGTFERFKNRFWDYPRWLRTHATDFDVFHVVDHSYAHVVHALPAQSTIVTCHDVDAFLPIVQPELTTSQLPKWLTRRVLAGLQKARAVACDTKATLDELLGYGLVPAERLAIVHNGVHESLSPDPVPGADRLIDALIGPRNGGDPILDLLHVGSCIPRKRIDLLLHIFAAVREVEPRARLLKAGGVLTDEQRRLAVALGIAPHIVQLPFLDPEQLASLYRRARVVVMTSEREGFGLPVIEAMACGTPVVASDLPVFREVGGTAAVYQPVGDIGRWRDAILRELREAEDETVGATSRVARIKQAAKFTWASYAESMLTLYQGVWEARAA